MTDEEIDDVLKAASGTEPEVEPALLDRIADSLRMSLSPVRPLPSTWMLTAELMLACAAVAVAAGAWAGLLGVKELDTWERILIFSTLGILGCATGRELVSQMVPGSRQLLSAGALLAAVGAVLQTLFALTFRDYHTEHFFTAGIVCLRAGVLLAVPAGLLSGLLLRQGFAVSPVAAGLAGGTLAGLCGLTMLELHCADFQALHILVWHTAVVPVSGAAGALVGRVLQEY